MFSLPEAFAFSLPSISLPTIVLPDNIQRRFLSFLLRRTIGRFVKPGQLDISQIEAQIGGGKVDIKDVQLDPEAINTLIGDLPLQLQDGGIGKVAAQVPLPNIFTAPFSLTVSSLHLTLVLTQPQTPPSDPETTLAESVASVAEKFVHDELTEKENRELLHTVAGTDLDDDESDGEDHRPPGSINPYLDDDATEVRSRRRQRRSPAREDDGLADADSASIIAVVVERLLSRFSFNATDTVIKVVHPGHADYILRIPVINYATEEEKSGETIVKLRTVKLSGISAWVKLLAPRRQYSTGSTASAPSSGSRAASPPNSDDEDEMDESMYQSALYESAVSWRAQSARHSPVVERHAPLPPPPISREPVEEQLLSFGTDPIVIRLSNVYPAVIAAPVVDPSTSPGSPPSMLSMSQHAAETVTELKRKSQLSIDISVGLLASALELRHLKGILTTAEFASPAPSSSSATTQSATSTPSSAPFRLQVKIKGILALLLHDLNPPEDLISKFYGQPLSHPIPTHHLRIHLDTIEASLSGGSLAPSSMTAAANLATPSYSTRQVASLIISDLSIFAIRRRRLDQESWTASPIIIHDDNLPYQYDSSNLNSFPIFEVSDWRASEGLVARPSLWRAHIPPHNRRRLSANVSSGGRAVLVRRELDTRYLEVSLQPLHIFLDLEVIGDILPALSELSEPGPTAPYSAADAQRTPKPVVLDIIEDMDAQNARMSGKQDTGMRIILECPMVRMQIRAPSVTLGRVDLTKPPPSPRSGSFVVDIHGTRIVTGEESSSESGTRFSANEASGKRSSKRKLLAKVKWKRILLSLAGVDEPRAVAFASVAAWTEDGPAQLTHSPVVLIRKSEVSNPTDVVSTSIECRLPEVNVKLDKPTFDGLQLWADDTAQWSERLGRPDSVGTGTNTTDTSMIGSRYFAHTPKGVGSLVTMKNSHTPQNPGETVISVVVNRACVRLLVPRGPLEGTMDSRPFVIEALDIDALIEVKPEGKDETVMTISARELRVNDSSEQGNTILFLEPNISPDSGKNMRSMLKVHITSGAVPETTAKNSSVMITASGFTYHVSSDIAWVNDLARFAKAPPGAFESVVPSERTGIWLKVVDGSVKVTAPTHPGALILAIKELEFLTQLVSEAPETEAQLRIPGLSLLFIDDKQVAADSAAASPERMARLASPSTAERWMLLGYAYVLSLTNLDARIFASTQPLTHNVDITGIRLSLHICADTVAGIAAFGVDLASAFQKPEDLLRPPTPKKPTIHVTKKPKNDIFSSIDEDAFRAAPSEDIPGDLMNDDIPKNMDYLDATYGASGGVEAFSDDEDYGVMADESDSSTPASPKPTPITPVRDQATTRNREDTIRIFDILEGIEIIEDFYANLVPIEDMGPLFDYALTARIRVKDCEVRVHLHDGYDYMATQKAFEEEHKAFRRKLLKIRQLIATGQKPDETLEDATHALIFNSVHVGVNDRGDMEDTEWLAAIDRELDDDVVDDNATVTSWQSLGRSQGGTSPARPVAMPRPSSSKSYRVRGKKLTRSRHSRIEICLYNVEAEFDKLHPNEAELVSRALVKVENFEILDHLKTSTWKKFLTEMKSDARGNVRETGSHMAKVELRMVKPTSGFQNEEARLKMKLLPIRLHVDQDALDFLKAFGAFQPPNQSPSPAAAKGKSTKSDEIFFQHVEVFPVALKLDYKPKRVDYRALREGRTIELMNFFHFDGAEMVLRHIELNGITGWATLGDTLNDLWTPDVKANQLVDVISGIAPVRSVVNVGSGLADLIVLPISQYKKDGRIMRGVHRGFKSFKQTTAMEAVKLGAKLATGTQLVLEEAEGLLSGAKPGESVILAPAGGASPRSVTRDSLYSGSSDEGSDAGTLSLILGGRPAQEEGSTRMISKYAEQPQDVREGVQAAYKSLKRNFNETAQTILAMPIELYDGPEQGPVRKVVKIVPIAVLKPMIGAAEAVSKTLLGLRNTMDPSNRLETEEKYKR